jgi:ABC-type nitrate/sulfonate/bicarbonate transport system substrate-binding protein
MPGLEVERDPVTAGADSAVMRIATSDWVTNSFFPALAAEELGFFRAEGIDARVEPLQPGSKAMAELREGRLAFVAHAAHITLTAFPRWEGARCVVRLSHGTPWLLVLRRDLATKRGDVSIVRGLRIGAAPLPALSLRRLLRDAGLDPDRDVTIGSVPGGEAPDASWGVLAADALEAGRVDGFWANALGAELAVRRGIGEVVVDVRRGAGLAEARDFTFVALVATERMIAEAPDRVAAAVRAIVKVQRALRADPGLATEVGRRRFPADAADVIAALVARDLEFYDPVISEATVTAMNDFSRSVGLLPASVPYDQVVARQFAEHWRA